MGPGSGREGELSLFYPAALVTTGCALAAKWSKQAVPSGDQSIQIVELNQVKTHLSWASVIP